MSLHRRTLWFTPANVLIEAFKSRWVLFTTTASVCCRPACTSCWCWGPSPNGSFWLFTDVGTTPWPHQPVQQCLWQLSLTGAQHWMASPLSPEQLFHWPWRWGQVNLTGAHSGCMKRKHPQNHKWSYIPSVEGTTRSPCPEMGVLQWRSVQRDRVCAGFAFYMEWKKPHLVSHTSTAEMQMPLQTLLMHTDQTLSC